MTQSTSNIPPWRAVRQSQGLALRRVARESGLDPAHLSRVERGQSQLSVESMHRLAGVLGLKDLARLLGPYVEEKAQ